MQYILELLQRPEAQTIVIAVIAFVFGLVKKIESVKKWKLGVALNSIEAGVMDTYKTYVRNLKDSNADGKLTKAEKEEALRRAIEKAKEFAKDEGLDLLKYYSKEFLPVIIEKIISRNKTAGALARGVLNPLLNGPELTE